MRPGSSPRQKAASSYQVVRARRLAPGGHHGRTPAGPEAPLGDNDARSSLPSDHGHPVTLGSREQHHPDLGQTATDLAEKASNQANNETQCLRW